MCRLHQGLRGINVSTVASLDEGLEETLTLDGLGAYSHGIVHPLRRQVRTLKYTRNGALVEVYLRFSMMRWPVGTPYTLDHA
jgi:hypothetical protein